MPVRFGDVMGRYDWLCVLSVIFVMHDVGTIGYDDDRYGLYAEYR